MAKPPSDNVRLTITVSPQVHAAFTEMADVSGMSLGRCMGEWLADTLEGAQFVTAQLVKAREAPRQVAKEMRQHLLGALDESDQLLADLRSGKLKVAPARQRPSDAGGTPAAASGAEAPPRPVIRGGKSPGKTLKPGPGRSSK